MEIHGPFTAIRVEKTSLHAPEASKSIAPCKTLCHPCLLLTKNIHGNSRAIRDHSCLKRFSSGGNSEIRNHNSEFSTFRRQFRINNSKFKILHFQSHFRLQKFINRLALARSPQIYHFFKHFHRLEKKLSL